MTPFVQQHPLLLLVTIIMATWSTTAGLSQDQLIYNQIFTNYSTVIRPISNSSQSLTVNLKFELTKINDIDEVNQVMHVVGFFICVSIIIIVGNCFGVVHKLINDAMPEESEELEIARNGRINFPYITYIGILVKNITLNWKDDNLVWNAADFGGVDRLIVPAKYIWVPDFAIVNSADIFYHSEFVNDFRVLIKNTGEVIWSFGGNIAVSCELDLTFYPFDQQMCYMKIENWQYQKSEVELLNSTSEVEKDEFHANGMWTVTRTEAEAGVIYHQAFPTVPYPLIKFKMYLLRKPGYYVINILVPCLVLALLALMVFWLPPDAGEKIGLGITIILAFSVFALIVAENTPRTSDSYPLLSIWMVILIAVSALNTMITIIVLHFHHHLPSRPPQFLRIVFISGLGRVLCVAAMSEQEPGDNEVIEIQSGQSETDSLAKPPLDGIAATPEASGGQNSELVVHVKSLLKQLKIVTKSIQEAERNSVNTDEWMAIARVIDRLCFWINLFVITVSTIVCFSLRGEVTKTD